jgi:hypothetical protein
LARAACWVSRPAVVRAPRALARLGEPLDERGLRVAGLRVAELRVVERCAAVLVRLGVWAMWVVSPSL